jgi:hypothetical protein
LAFKVAFSARSPRRLAHDSLHDHVERFRHTVQLAVELLPNAGALRGDFYPSDKVGGVSSFTRDEELAYRGVHFVQAFLVL